MATRRRRNSPARTSPRRRPDRHIDGFPFLTQVLAGHYDQIDIVVPEPPAKGIRLDSLRVVATGVDAPTSTVMSGDGQVVAAKVVGTGEIAWASFEQMVDLSGLQQYGIDPSTLTITGTDDGTITLSAPRRGRRASRSPRSRPERSRSRTTSSM